jgi:hypothetical protein
MSYAEMTEIAGGVRELTENELTMVAGGSVWTDLGKLVGGAVGRALIGGYLGLFVGGAAVIVGQEVYNNYNPSPGCGNCGANVGIGDAAL